MGIAIDGTNMRGSRINTNSKQYKAAMEHIGTELAQIEAGMTPEQKLIHDTFGNRDTIIRNWMRYFDKDGDYISPITGIAGMDITGKDPSEWKQIISIPEDARQNMFDNVKREFIAEKGVHNGDTTKRSEVFQDYQRSVPKNQRLKGTWTLEQYERQYYNAIYNAVKENNPNWTLGKSFDTNILKHVTREKIDRSVIDLGDGRLALRSIDYNV